ncbi:MBL fold metallo-hydrolase RNA specificity domain-containing protein [Nitrincola sp. MINF-07-Sa-05]|uniref:MBL fold metallo-hydrolase RNA specificity domain-containing protein n=1 Tax=Nitrincola salilacus TaxID=3400273 RepID=UPI0039184BF3
MPDPANAYPNIIHHGGASGVTGSCHQLNCDSEHSLLIDCGLFQGRDAADDTFEQLKVQFDLSKIKALLITHVHIDHVGRLPYLIAAGYNGPIYCSKPSALLLPLVLEDALRVGFTRDAKLIEQFKARIAQLLVPLDYKTWHTVIDTPALRTRIKLQRAGHILGSCYFEISVTNKPDHNTRIHNTRIVFSGDLGAPGSALLPAPQSPHHADIVVLESTYGNRRHQSRHDRINRLKAAIEKALQNDGTVIIPAFSIGRTQELLYELEELIHRHSPGGDGKTKPLWKNLQVIVDSPLAAEFTKVYRQLKPYWDDEAQRRLKAGRHPLNFANLYTIGNHDEHQRTVDYLAKTGQPAVVIAASGMAAGGRVMNYLKAMIEDSRHQVLFVGYQAPGTPGHQIQNATPGKDEVTLEGQRYRINAGVDSISGYSAHADQKDLVNFIRRMKKWPREVRLIHGDQAARLALKDKIEQAAQAAKQEIRVELAEARH